MKIELSNYVIMAEDGSIDLEETLEKFETDVIAWDDAKKNGNVRVLGALHKVFDKNLGKGLPMDYLVNQVVLALGVNTPEAFADISERVPETVKSNPTVFANARRIGTIRLADKPAATDTK